MRLLGSRGRKARRAQYWQGSAAGNGGHLRSYERRGNLGKGIDSFLEGRRTFVERTKPADEGLLRFGGSPR